MEKCARFHIHCTARLCELDMQDFDQKINDENLTKCMQTLKHMYYDLSLKNVFCPNEAEFRSYDVLLHLNDGEVLRLLFLSPQILLSALILTQNSIPEKCYSYELKFGVLVKCEMP